MYRCGLIWRAISSSCEAHYTLKHKRHNGFLLWVLIAPVIMPVWCWYFFFGVISVYNPFRISISSTLSFPAFMLWLSTGGACFVCLCGEEPVVRTTVSWLFSACSMKVLWYCEMVSMIFLIFSLYVTYLLFILLCDLSCLLSLSLRYWMNVHKLSTTS